MSFLGALSGGNVGSLLSGLGGLGANQLVVFSNPRTIGTIVIDCTLTEGATDALEITQHPVEQGANVTDHAIVLPSVITFRALWNNSSFNANGDPQYAIDIYNQLLAQQQSRQPIQVSTGKRQIQTGLIKSLVWSNDHTTDQALTMDITIQEIILVSTQGTGGLPAVGNQGNPACTSQYQNTGSLQPVATSTDPNSLGGDASLP